MTVSTKRGAQPRRGRGRKTAPPADFLSLPPSTTTIEIGGVAYVVTPQADMRDWLEDLEDILDSVAALNEPGAAIPWDEAKKQLRSRAGK